MHDLTVSIKLAFKNLRSNVGRTLLSLLGIVIGVASVILVLSFGSGMKQYIVDQVSSFGTNVISVKIKVPKVLSNWMTPKKSAPFQTSGPGMLRLSANRKRLIRTKKSKL
jgi:ABC-type lipoprotein release transport system permease subunit